MTPTPPEHDAGDDPRRKRYATVFGELLEALRAVPPSNELSIDLRARLRRAAEAARRLIAEDNLRTRSDWATRGHIRRGKVYLEERDLRRLERAEQLVDG